MRETQLPGEISGLLKEGNVERSKRLFSRCEDKGF